MDRPDFVMNKIRNNFIDNHVVHIYEDICIEKMWGLNTKNTWNFNFDKAGHYWNSNTEIDVVAFDSTGNDIIFGECKYTEKKIDVDIFFDLVQKAKEVKWKNTNRREWYVLFSINGFTNEMMKLVESRDDISLCN